RRGRHCRSAKWRRRADSAQPRASLRALTVREALARPLVLAFVVLLEEIPESVRHAFFDHVVKVGLESFAELGLDIASKSSAALMGGLKFVMSNGLWPRRRPLPCRPGHLRPLPQSAMSAIVLGRPARALAFAGLGCGKWFLLLHNFHPSQHRHEALPSVI